VSNSLLIQTSPTFLIKATFFFHCKSYVKCKIKSVTSTLATAKPTQKCECLLFWYDNHNELIIAKNKTCYAFNVPYKGKNISLKALAYQSLSIFAFYLSNFLFAFSIN
jgi:hypothetical protein